jgi:hypothetical protein
MINKPKHATHGPSSSARWFACPGSINAEAAMPGMDNSSPAAVAGTAAHEALELALKSGKLITESLADFPEMVEVASAALHEVEERSIGAKLVASEVQLAPFPGIPEVWGTADAVIVRERELEVIDLKTGIGIIEADAPQLKIYSLLAREAFGSRPDGVVTTIVQPAARHDDGPVRSYRYSNPDLDDFAMELRRRVVVTQRPDAPRVAGGHCKFCKAAPTCEALKAHVFAGFHVVTPAEQAEDAELAELLDSAEPVTGWAKAVKDEALRRALDGHSIPGWKLVRRRGRRVWADEEAAVNTLMRAGLSPTDLFEPTVLRSPAQVENMLRYSDSRKTLRSLVEMRPGEIALVRENEPGEPVSRVRPGATFDGVRVVVEDDL